MDLSDITNYDVLVEPPSPGREGGDYQLAKHKSHVGNNRLEVFLNLYQQAYEKAHQAGNQQECSKIVEKIVDTVCHQCVPRGRFLVSIANHMDRNVSNWEQMSEENARRLLHNVLRPQQIPSLKSPSVADDNLKRRRRSSLLRRSASEGMVTSPTHFNKSFMDKKKVTRIIEDEPDQPAWKTTRNPQGGITTLNRMDVILTSTRDALDPNSQSVGNNRLHILLAMQNGPYKHANADGKDRILDEVMKTVITFWKGRFLVEAVFGYNVLTSDEARSALACIFASRTGQREASANGNAPGQSNRPSMSTYKQASMSMLSNSVTGITPLPEMENLRSAAVKSLQKQKARQNTAAKLAQISRSNAVTSSNPDNLGIPQELPLKLSDYEPTPLPEVMSSSSVAMNSSVNNNNARRSNFRQSVAPRESTVLGKLDPHVMDQLIADFEEADCEDDDDFPLPASNSNEFGGKFLGGP